MDNSDINFSGQRPRFSNKTKQSTDDDGGFKRATTAPSQQNGTLNASAKPFVAKDDAI